MMLRARIEEVLEYLGLRDSPILEELRSEGLFEEDWLEPDVAEELRVAASLIHDLGANAAGVEVVLQMRRRMFALEDLMGRSPRQLIEEFEGR